MKTVIQILLLLAAANAHAMAADSTIAIEGFYGMASISPSDLNTAHSDFLWNSATPAGGSFKNLTYFGGSIGYKVYDPVYLMLRYEMNSQLLSSTAVSGATYSVQDGFKYNPLYLLADVPYMVSDGIYVSFRAGVGYALNYEYHQTLSGGTDVTWKANPIGFRVGGTGSYSLSDNFELFAELFYESIKSGLKAEQNYATTINGTPIVSGQTLTNVTTGSSTTADLSGVHYGLGLRIRF